jgi:hypothetical protein
VPTAVANSTDTTAVIKNFIDSTTNQTLQPGTTIKETTVLMNKVTYVSDKNAPANNQCNPAPAAGSSSSPSGTPTAVPTSASATDTTVPTSSVDPTAATPSSATSSTDAQPTPAPGAASPSAPAPAAEASATTTTAADPAASTGATNSRRSIKEVTNKPVTREPETQDMQLAGGPSGQDSPPNPSRDEPAPQRQSGSLKRTSGPPLPREPSPAPAPVRTSGLTEHEPAPTEQPNKRGPILPRRLGFSGAALASLARRSNDH